MDDGGAFLSSGRTFLESKSAHARMAVRELLKGPIRFGWADSHSVHSVYMVPMASFKTSLPFDPSVRQPYYESTLVVIERIGAFHFDFTAGADFGPDYVREKLNLPQDTAGHFARFLTMIRQAYAEAVLNKIEDQGRDA